MRTAWNTVLEYMKILVYMHLAIAYNYVYIYILVVNIFISYAYMYTLMAGVSAMHGHAVLSVL